MHLKLCSAGVLAVRRRVPYRVACRVRCSAVEPAGLGCSSEDICDLSPATVFRSMMNQIDMPARFLPVSSVSVRPAEGDAGDDGALWRSMTYNGMVIQEHIYANPSRGLIRFVELEADGSEGGLEVINLLHKSPLRMEYYQRHRTSLERTHWTVPKTDVMGAIRTIIALARAQEQQRLDPGFVAAKA